MSAGYPQLAPRITIKRAEANAFLQDICRGWNWNSSRAVLFLDPYGMQVEWPTVEAIARTQAIDMWLLFPLGMSVNRLLTRDGSIPQAWIDRLDHFFGTHEWLAEFYKEEVRYTLFGESVATVKACSYDSIGAYFVKRLRTVFAAVARNPLTLCNSNNVPLYLLCFAAGNKKGGAIAKKIAEHILSMPR